MLVVIIVHDWGVMIANTTKRRMIGEDVRGNPPSRVVVMKRRELVHDDTRNEKAIMTRVAASLPVNLRF